MHIALSIAVHLPLLVASTRTICRLPFCCCCRRRSPLRTTADIAFCRRRCTTITFAPPFYSPSPLICCCRRQLHLAPSLHTTAAVAPHLQHLPFAPPPFALLTARHYTRAQHIAAPTQPPFSAAPASAQQPTLLHLPFAAFISNYCYCCNTLHLHSQFCCCRRRCCAAAQLLLICRICRICSALHIGRRPHLHLPLAFAR